ncbi:hypothetical protein I5907_08745 [Panacibacter sp. DH6]|uniref:DNA mismatch repair proteins mutS family domain-containing protein n=1 Tax=Panacibacter microcysteis TaxID=2793269 RepID=A0A931E9T7_9BACT|nr:hypothetical protein [Panacibacter microcysteis]MBG9376321.1 hypothetical protein [Panacibacter microcysteis]
MNNNDTAASYYHKRITELDTALKTRYSRRTLFGWLRFGVIALTILAVYATWNAGTAYIIATITGGVALFLFIVSKDSDNKSTIENLETLHAVNKDEIAYQQGDYYHQYDGKDLEPWNHAYAADLDLFGRASLYQYINRCHAEKAKALLAERLLQPLPKTDILQQQQAVKELTSKPEWRQQLQAFGSRQKITVQTEQRVLNWLAEPEKYYTRSYWNILRFLLPAAAVGTLVLYFTGLVSTTALSALIFIFYIVSLAVSKKITGTYHLLSRIVPEISVLSNQLNWFEKEKFESDLLAGLQKELRQNNLQASGEIAQLKAILNRFDVRLNVFAFILLNTFLLWDLQQFMALKKWKEKNKAAVPGWFSTIASVEVAGTLATLAFNHEKWAYPIIADEHFVLAGEAIGHPLIPQANRVNNSFTIKGTARIDLITGSNMAGKSTFLRSLGINLILAYTGAPVCAKSFTISIAKLMSSMRITDNLAENTSTFYAELKKLKSIIEAVGKHADTFILLDEILRGTNSLDRHTGSAALIKQLIKENAVALIATHDVELAKLETGYPQNIANYHFDVQVAGEELYFDYKLKHGICTSLNASILMKKIGIEL